MADRYTFTPNNFAREVFNLRSLKYTAGSVSSILREAFGERTMIRMVPLDVDEVYHAGEQKWQATMLFDADLADSPHRTPKKTIPVGLIERDPWVDPKTNGGGAPPCR